jgi:cell filamentation protein
VTFDPFGDFETKGYLRNFAREKDRAIVRQMEHSSFTTALDDVFDALAEHDTLTYSHVLQVHRSFFDAVYPWAGEDRTKNAPHLAISKTDGHLIVRFADPADIQRATDYALLIGQNKAFMAANPGTVMGYLAFAHPFLDGNGRTIMAIHCVLAHRAGVSIDWASTNKTDYLAALTRELNDPDNGHLDAYLKPFVHSGLSHAALPANIAAAPGLDGDSETQILGQTDDAALKAEYEAEKLKRQQAFSSYRT